MPMNKLRNWHIACPRTRCSEHRSTDRRSSAFLSFARRIYEPCSACYAEHVS